VRRIQTVEFNGFDSALLILYFGHRIRFDFACRKVKLEKSRTREIIGIGFDEQLIPFIPFGGLASVAAIVQVDPRV